MTLTAENAMFGHTDEDSAFVVDDYPYGFRLRTEIRYWIETTKNGDRLCSQTMNPKTGRWNKAKKSTYSEVGVMYLDEKGHVTWAGLSTYADDEWIANFLVITEGKLSEMQKAKVARVIGLKKAFEGVKWTVKEGPSTPEDEAEHAKAMAFIARKAAVETHKALGELS